MITALKRGFTCEHDPCMNEFVAVIVRQRTTVGSIKAWKLCAILVYPLFGSLILDVDCLAVTAQRKWNPTLSIELASKLCTMQHSLSHQAQSRKAASQRYYSVFKSFLQSALSCGSLLFACKRFFQLIIPFPNWKLQLDASSRVMIFNCQLSSNVLCGSPVTSWGTSKRESCHSDFCHFLSGFGLVPQLANWRMARLVGSKARF